MVDAKKMAKHFELDIADRRFAYRRRTDAIAAEAVLDGWPPVYVQICSFSAGSSG